MTGPDTWCRRRTSRSALLPARATTMTRHVIDPTTSTGDDRSMTTTEPTDDIAHEIDHHIDLDTARAGMDGFFAAWNVTDDAQRRQAIERTYTEDGCFSDPTAQVIGHDAIEEHIIGTMAVFAGRTFEAVGEPDLHHDRLRFEWRMVSPEGATELLGVDVVHLAADGRFADSTGFFLPST